MRGAWITRAPRPWGLVVAALVAACGSSAPGGALDPDTVAPEVATNAPGDTAAAPADTEGVVDGTSAAPADTEGVADATVWPAVERSRYEADLAFIARPRVPGSGHWQAVQDLCAERLESLGFAVERHAYGTGVNVVGVLAGTVAPGEQVVVSAHYDHLPGCSGADDNASGVAGLLEVARVLAAGPHARSLVVACWDEEERGLIGSRAWAERAVTRGDRVVAMYDFDMIGYRDDAPGSQTLPDGFDLLFPEAAATIAAHEGRGDFIAVIADGSDTSGAAAAAFAQASGDVDLRTVVLQLPEGTETSPLLADVRRSDHAVFWDQGIPALLITDTSEFRYGGYHCADGDDSPDRLDATFATAVVAATVASARTLLSSTDSPEARP